MGYLFYQGIVNQITPDSGREFYLNHTTALAVLLIDWFIRS